VGVDSRDGVVVSDARIENDGRAISRRMFDGSVIVCLVGIRGATQGETESGNQSERRNGLSRAIIQHEQPFHEQPP
jgi:hypothetical protein